MRLTLQLAGSFSLLLKLAAAQCKTITTTQIGIDTTVADLQAFQSSLDAKYSRSGGSITGNTVFIHTSLYTYPGGSFTGYGIYESDALKSEGFQFVTQTVTETSCETTETPETEPPQTGHTLPPSPTGSICSPHVDHWHCQPSPTETDAAGSESSPTSAPATCTPHEDHWHCPPGVASPTYEPSEAPSSTTTLAATCTPHEDHWHCPPGVASPTYKPSEAPSTFTSSRTTATSSSGGGSSGGSTTSSPALSAPSTVATGGAARPAAFFAACLGAFFSFYAFI